MLKSRVKQNTTFHQDHKAANEERCSTQSRPVRSSREQQPNAKAPSVTAVPKHSDNARLQRPRQTKTDRPTNAHASRPSNAHASDQQTVATLDVPALIKKKSWGAVVERLEKFPLEAQRCHYLSLNGDCQDGDGGLLSRALPLHLVATLKPPSSALQAIIDVNCSAASAKESSGGMIPLHLACINGSSPNCIKALIFAYRDGARTLDTRGKLPLHYACEHGTAEEVSLLLKAAPSGAFIKDRDGMNALALARKSQNPHLEEITAAMKRYKLRAIKAKPNTVRVSKSTRLRSSVGSLGGKTTLEVAMHRCSITAAGIDEVLIAQVEQGEETSNDNDPKESDNNTDMVRYVVSSDESADPLQAQHSNLQPHVSKKTNQSGAKEEDTAPKFGDCSKEDEELELDNLLKQLESDRSRLSENQQDIDKIDEELAISDRVLKTLKRRGEGFQKEAVLKQNTVDNSKRKIDAYKSQIEQIKKELAVEELVLSQSRQELRDTKGSLEACFSKVKDEEANRSALESDREALHDTHQEQSSRTLQRDNRLEQLLSKRLDS